MAIDSTTPSLDDPADTAERFDDDSGDSLDLGPVDRISERPADAAPEYLDGDSALDPILERTPPAELYPERFTPTTADQQAALEGAYEADHRPEAWISEVNPGFQDDLVNDRPGRTTNCAECARAFQQGLEGRPVTAAGIDEQGLRAPGSSGSWGGEISRYTEQWAGREMTPARYDAIGDELRKTGGSAIVHANDAGNGAGHAFNAFWDDRRGEVLWADAQLGEVGPWPPEHLEDRFPATRVMYFDKGAGT